MQQSQCQWGTSRDNMLTQQPKQKTESGMARPRSDCISITHREESPAHQEWVGLWPTPTRGNRKHVGQTLENQNGEEALREKMYPAEENGSLLTKLERRERNKPILAALLPDNERWLSTDTRDGEIPHGCKCYFSEMQCVQASRWQQSWVWNLNYQCLWPWETYSPWPSNPVSKK